MDRSFDETVCLFVVDDEPHTVLDSSRFGHEESPSTELHWGALLDVPNDAPSYEVV